MYQKENKELKIIALYTSDYSQRLYLREISRKAQVPLKTVQNVLYLLEKNKILILLGSLTIIIGLAVFMASRMRRKR